MLLIVHVIGGNNVSNIVVNLYVLDKSLNFKIQQMKKNEALLLSDNDVY